MNKDDKKIFNDKDRIVISGNDIDSIFISDINFDDDNNYPVISIGDIESINNLSRNMKNYNNLKRDKNTDILSISGENIDNVEYVAQYEADDLTIENNLSELTSIEKMPKFNASDIVQNDDTTEEDKSGFNGILSQFDLDNAIIAYEENKDDSTLLRDDNENNKPSNEDEKMKKLASFFEDVIKSIPKNKREKIINSEDYKDYLSIVNKK